MIRPAHTAALLLALPVASIGALVATAPVTAAESYAQGEEVLITGVVTDSEGMPIPDLRVTIEASRAAFSFRKLRRTRENTTRLATQTDERGEFSLPWRWDDYYNRFTLVLAVPVRKPGGEELYELQRVDLSRRMNQGGPVASSLVVDETRAIDSRRDFLAALDSEDERNVYEQAGQPEQVQQVHYPSFEEVTWWYFSQGRAYRFRDGTLHQVIPFDPIEPF